MPGRFKAKQRLLERIAGEVKRCRKCRLYKYAKNGVTGEGNADAAIMFIGEAPGLKEDLTGRPFVGRAGKFLDELLAGIGIKREDVFIGNIVKHRPRDNRAPKPDEIESCTPYLDRQIRIIRPKIVIPLGRHSAKYIFTKINEEFESITAVRGKSYRKRIFDIPVTIIPAFHPAAALYSQRYKAIMMKDFQKIKSTVLA